MSCVINVGGAVRGNTFCAFVFAALSISAVTLQFYLLEELSQHQVGERPCITSQFPLTHRCELEAWKDRHRVFQAEMSPALRYFTAMGNCPREATENPVNSMYSSSSWDHQTLYICDYRNTPVCHPFLLLSILHFVWFSSLLIVPSYLGFLDVGREGLFFVTDLLQHYCNSLLLSKVLRNVLGVQIPCEIAYQLLSWNPLNSFTLFPLALRSPHIMTRAVKNLWNSGWLTSAVISSGNLKWRLHTVLPQMGLGAMLAHISAMIILSALDCGDIFYFISSRLWKTVEIKTPAFFPL